MRALALLAGLLALRQRSFLACMRKPPVGGTPKEFEALIRADLERWTAIARDLKLEPQ